MSLVGLFVALVVICLLAWAGRTIMDVFGLDARIRAVITVIFVVFVCLWLLQAFLGGGPFLGVGTIRLR